MSITPTKVRGIVGFMNAALRMTSLAAKLALTLYMGRFLSLADMGMYGLVAGAVIPLIDVLGVRLDFVVSRELVGAGPVEALAIMRDQAVFYGLNYIALALIMGVLTMVDITGVSSKIMLAIFVLSVVENCASMTYLNIIAMGRPLIANILFFIRSGLWVFPVMAAGVLMPKFRTANTIFLFWAVGVTASLVVTLWVWRSMPWAKVIKTPIQWGWIKNSVKRCFFVWLGAVGTTTSFYVGRFVVAQNLGLDLAGVATFYSSFTAALYALIQSGIFAFSYPRMIALHKNKDEKGFRQEARKVAWHAALFAGIVAVLLAVAVPMLGEFFHRPLLVQEAPVFWLMMFGMWTTVNAGTLYYILFARHQDFAIWLGDLLCLALSISSNTLFIKWFGFIGVGYSALLWSVFLMLWRGWHVRYGTRP